MAAHDAFELWLASISFTQPCTQLINIPLPNLTFGSFGPNNRLTLGRGGKLRGNWPVRAMHFTYDHFSVEGTRILGLVVRPVNTGNPFPSMLDLAKNWNACLVKRARGSVASINQFPRYRMYQKLETPTGKRCTLFMKVARASYVILSAMRKCFLKQL